MNETREVEAMRCVECEEELTNEADTYRFDGNIYCERCYDENVSTCEMCSLDFNRDDARWCRECDDGPYCEDCLREHEGMSEDEESVEEIKYRHYHTLPLTGFCSEEAGTIITSPRVFSCEIECYPKSMSAAVELSHNLASAWGVSGDGSLRSGGIELQSPLLAGKAGERAVREACDLLTDAGAKTDRTCGLHIHLDGKGVRELGAIKNMLMAYIAYEDVILSFLPPSRRSNQYARQMRGDFHAAEIRGAQTLDRLEKLWYRERITSEVVKRKGEKYDISRYHGVNLHSLLRDGHLEIRYHSGTTNARKILEWANLHQRIMDMSASTHHIPSIDDIVDLGERTESLLSWLSLTDTSREYWLERQKLFTSMALANEEASMITTTDEIVTAPIGDVGLCVG